MPGVGVHDLHVAQRTLPSEGAGRRGVAGVLVHAGDPAARPGLVRQQVQDAGRPAA
jgi:hypothetical protein